jgi:hypothetical protein
VPKIEKHDHLSEGNVERLPKEIFIHMKGDIIGCGQYLATAEILNKTEKLFRLNHLG